MSESNAFSNHYETINNNYDENAETIRDACISKSTKDKYRNCISVIIRWIKNDLSVIEPNIERFFNDSNELDLSQFTPQYFEKILVYRRNSVKTTTLSLYRSAIKDLYRVNRIPLPIEYGEKMVTLFSGMKRLEAERNQSGNPRHSGKAPLPYSVYVNLCNKTLLAFDGGFSHLFITSQWNLMCRSKSVETLQTYHLINAEDSIGIMFHKTKTNQDGHGPKDPRHIYGNPFSPETCWITALAVYLACNGRLNPGCMFPGKNQKLRFSKLLSGLLKNNTDISLNSYGTHSVRKGVATYSCGGSTGGPSIVSVCLRCGWSLGGVQDRYLRYAAAGDQYLGRVVAGLPQNKSEFAVLPPHFNEHGNLMVKECIINMFPSLYQEVNLYPILRLCLASLVYHHRFLESTLHEKHALRSTYIFRNESILNYLLDKVSIENSNYMTASGIPPYIGLYKKMDIQLSSINRLPDIIEDRIGKLIEEKGIGAANITKEVLRETVKALLADVGLNQRQVSEISSQQSSSPRTLHYWGGKFHILPESFDFPSIGPLGAWKLWWFGHQRQGYPPYKGIKPDDLSTSKKKATYSEWSIFMRMVINGIEDDIDGYLLEIKTESEAIKLFEIGYNKLVLKKSKHKRRYEQLKITTVLRLVREAAYDTEPNRHRRPYKRRKTLK